MGRAAASRLRMSAVVLGIEALVGPRSLHVLLLHRRRAHVLLVHRSSALRRWPDD